MYADTSGFVDRMIALRGRPEGAYAANLDFYSNALGRIDALTARAQAGQVLNNCPSTQVTDRILATANIPQDVRAQLGRLDPGSCQIVVLQALRRAFNERLRAYHQVRGDAGIPEEARGPILTGGVGSLFRTAILIEAAKRSGEG